MKTSEFNYELPQDLIAQAPLAERSASRMLVLDRRTGSISHGLFADLPSLLSAGDLVVVNTSRVIPARVFGKRIGSGGKVEVMLLEQEPSGRWLALFRASRPPRKGLALVLGNGEATAEVEEVLEYGKVYVRIMSEWPVLELLDRIGLPPLPPYIKRDRATVKNDDTRRYQTVYAESAGSVAAPTAGLHFTEEVLKKIELAGVRRASVVLHVGLGTFRPVKSDTVEEHVMESERFEVPEETARLIGETKRAGGRIIAVGSTTVRVLETVAGEAGEIKPCAGRTSIFIHPPHEFRAIDCMLTNFHLPMSTLLMMVCALAGRELVMKAYSEAIAMRYRFYSYGDCMMIV
ncbi:MAG: tRNA preQ1(34) S-adenosylmethionine ribosyltransferase-isomerase QueA [Verrucomicrobia bacterium]|nr:tRNA preQ1(34) S-adenosylmethionine ribosyltransferase-isomerase QueA [Verrucomicrobiota bacterium]